MPNRVRQFVYWVRGCSPKELLRFAKHQVNRRLRRLPTRPRFACHVRGERLLEALVPRMWSRDKNPFEFLSPIPPGIASPARNVFSREPRGHHADFPVFQFENDYISAIDRRCILYIQSDFIRRSIKQPHHANSLSLWDKNSNRGSGNRPSKARHIDAFRKCPATRRPQARRSAHPLWTRAGAGDKPRLNFVVLDGAARIKDLAHPLGLAARAARPGLAIRPTVPRCRLGPRPRYGALQPDVWKQILDSDAIGGNICFQARDDIFQLGLTGFFRLPEKLLCLRFQFRIC